MDLWIKIAGAILLIIMFMFLYPAAKRWMQDGPRAQPGDWSSALWPLVVVAGFVTLLIWLVR